MSGVFYFIGVAGVLGMLVHPTPKDDAGAPISETAICNERVGPGRVLCSVEVTSSRPLQWVDLVIEGAPAHLALLERRFSDKEATRRTETSAKFEVALIAKSHGAGEVPFLVRSVLCEKNAACQPHTLRVRAEARVAE